MTKISVIIPVKEINEYIRKFVPLILNQNFTDFEILILPDKPSKELFSKTRVIASGPGGPAMKRDLGAKKAKGEILAFIDDDAYPQQGWLAAALPHFENTNVGAVGGPNVTPPESNFFQQVSGTALASWIVSGPTLYRYIPKQMREVDDLPSCNLFIRKSLFLKLGGFDTSFWPGEDTKLCSDIKKIGKTIIYDPDVLVYHHRRLDLASYLKQIATYAKHRGFFAKKYPETSRKFSYFMPSLFVLGLLLGIVLSPFDTILKLLYLATLTIYTLLAFIEAVRTKKPAFIIPFILLVFLTHVAYGLGFIQGIFKRKLRSRYRA